MSKGVTFYFMRHAETFFNRENRVQGWSDAELTPEGIEDALASGRGFADLHFDAVYTSDSKRAIETAKYFLSANHYRDDYQMKPMQELREVNFGSYEGLPSSKLFNDLNEAFHQDNPPKESFVLPYDSPQILRMIKHLDPSHTAENYVEFWRRVESGLLILLNKHAGTNQNILVVSHGWTIRNLIHGLVADYEVGEPLKNASISIVEYIDGQFRLKAINQVNHFVHTL